MTEETKPRNNLWQAHFDLFKLLVYLLPILLLISIVNYKGDPANIFKNRSFENDIYKALKSGKNAGFALTMSQVNDALLVKKFINDFTKSKDVVVIGSSRSMPINHEGFPGADFFNASINTCRMGDMLALFSLFDSKKQIPKNLFLGLGPDFFVLDPKPGIELKNELLNFLPKLEPYAKKEFKQKVLNDFAAELRSQAGFNPFLAALSLNYFQDSFKYIYSKFNHNWKYTNHSVNLLKQVWKPIEEKNSRGGVIFPDGSREWSNELVFPKKDFKTGYIRRYTLLMDRFKIKNPRLRDDARVLFKSFIKYLKSKNINVFFFLAPYHPLTFQYERQKYKELDDFPPYFTEMFLLNISKAYQIPIIGSANPYILGFDNGDEIVDNHHPSRDATTMMFRKAFDK